jgi:hypothetical protein
LIWARLFAMLGRRYSIPASVRPSLRLDEYMYCPSDPSIAQRKFTGLFWKLPSIIKTKKTSDQTVWERLIMGTAPIPKTGQRSEADVGVNPLVEMCGQAMREAELRETKEQVLEGDGGGDGEGRGDVGIEGVRASATSISALSSPSAAAAALTRLSNLYLSGALPPLPRPIAYATRVHAILCRRSIIAGGYTAAVVTRQDSRPTAMMLAPHVVYLRVSPDLQSLVFSAERMGALRLSVPMSACCDINTDSKSAIYGKMSNTITFRFTATKEVERSLGSLVRSRNYTSTSPGTSKGNGAGTNSHVFGDCGSGAGVGVCAERCGSDRGDHRVSVAPTPTPVAGSHGDGLRALSRSPSTVDASSTSPAVPTSQKWPDPCPACSYTGCHIDLHLPTSHYPGFCFWGLALKLAVWRYGKIGRTIYGNGEGSRNEDGCGEG